MLQISGIGDLKMEKYGRDFLTDSTFRERRHPVANVGEAERPEASTASERKPKGDDTFAVT